MRRVGFVMLMMMGVIGGVRADISLGQSIGIDFASSGGSAGAGAETNFKTIDGNVTNESITTDVTGAVVSGVTVTTRGIQGTMGETNIGYWNVTGNYAGTLYSNLTFNDGVYTGPTAQYPPIIITISGLNDSLGYNLTGLVNGSNTVANTSSVTFTADGQSVAKTGQATYNAAGGYALLPSVINGVSTDGSGNLVVTVEGSWWFGIGGMTLTATNIRRAHTPTPGNEAVDVDPAMTALTWMSPDNPNDPNITGVTGYDVYFYGVDSVSSDDPNFTNVSSVAVTGESISVAQLPEALTNDKTYFWRVDSHVTWDSNEITGSLSDTLTGKAWSFETLLTDNPPIVDAGSDLITAQTFTPVASVAGTVDDRGEADLVPVLWSVETAPAGAVYSLPQGGTDAAPTATLTTDTAGDYTLRLTATDATQSVYDEIVVTVEVDACAAAVESGLTKSYFDVEPAGGDCDVDLLDFAVFAADWLDDIKLTGQVEK